MPLVKTDRLIDGMVLAADVATPRGESVLSSGTVVDRDAAARLRAAKIGVVEVTEESYGLAAMLPDGGAVRESEKQPVSRPESKTRQLADTTMVQANLLRIARMFNEYRDDPLMRELCRLAIKCAQERLIRV